MNTADHGLQLAVAGGSIVAGLASTWERVAT